MQKVENKRAHVVLPADVIASIDNLVGKRGRSASLASVAREEIQRRQQRSVLRKAVGAWKDRDHPELQHGSSAWVRQMRAASEALEPRVQPRRGRD
ncbi:MAG: hypothetical protein ABI165_03860 [Bryobacteraceae bacterium]